LFVFRQYGIDSRKIRRNHFTAEFARQWLPMQKKTLPGIGNRVSNAENPVVVGRNQSQPICQKCRASQTGGSGQSGSGFQKTAACEVPVHCLFSGSSSLRQTPR